MRSFLEGAIFQMITKIFRNEPFYVDFRVVDLMHEGPCLLALATPE